MQFKDIKQNHPIHILDKQEFCIITGKATAVSFPRVEINQKTGRSEMVIDVTIEANRKTATYTIPENLSVTYAGSLVLSTDKQGLAREVEAMVANADQIIASVPHAQKIKNDAPTILAELDPSYRDKQETEQRFNKIEGSMEEMKKMMQEFIKKFES